MRLAENTESKKSQKIHHVRTIAQICRAISLQLRQVSTIGKKIVKQQYLFHISSQYGELRPTSGCDQFGCLGYPSKFSTGFTSWLRYYSDVTQRKPTKLCTMFGHLLGCYLYTHFRGSCPVTEFCKVQNSLCVQVLLTYIGSITAWHSSSGRQPNFETLSTGRYLYSAGQPSRWALAHVLDELRFYIPLDTKQVISETLFPANVLASTAKTKSKNREK